MLKTITRKIAFSATLLLCLAAFRSDATATNGLNFDGSNSNYFSLVSNPVANNVAMTFEAWVDWQGASDNQMIFDFSNSVSGDHMYLTPSNSSTHVIRFGIVVNSVEETMDGSVALATGFHHVAVTVAGNGIWRLYIDGGQDAQSIGHLYRPTSLGVTDLNYFGKSHDIANPYFTGTLDEIRIWNRALCQAEISNNKGGEISADETGLVGYYKLNEGTAGTDNSALSTVADASISGNDGNLMNFALTGASTGNFIAGELSGPGTTYAPAPSSTSETVYHPINSTTLFHGCGAITIINPTGGSAVFGNVSDSVWIEPSVTYYYSQPLVARHYGIKPDSNANTATATVTLFYTQADFTAYNAEVSHGPDMPIDSSDAVNAANIRINKRDGVSSDGTGLYSSYSGAETVIIPDSVRWNGSSSRWEVTFNVTGFSGFFLNTNPQPLPLTLLSFTGKNEGTTNMLSWNTSEEVNTAYFDIQRSTDGKTFTTVGKVAAEGKISSSYAFTDNLNNGVAPTYYYKLKQVDLGGKYTYSNIVRIVTGKNSVAVEASPNPFRNTVQILITSGQAGDATIAIADITGKVQITQTTRLTAGANPVTVNTDQLSSGIYLLSITNNGQRQVMKIVKE